MTGKQILIVEDQKDLFEAIWLHKLHEFRFSLEIVFACTIKEAEENFHPKLDLIVMDACLHGRKPNTIELVKKFREDYKGPIIAISAVPNYRDMLMTAGCSCQCKKEDLPSKIIQILKLEKKLRTY